MPRSIADALERQRCGVRLDTADRDRERPHRGDRSPHHASADALLHAGAHTIRASIAHGHNRAAGSRARHRARPEFSSTASVAKLDSSSLAACSPLAFMLMVLAAGLSVTGSQFVLDSLEYGSSRSFRNGSRAISQRSLARQAGHDITHSGWSAASTRLQPSVLAVEALSQLCRPHLRDRVAHRRRQAAGHWGDARRAGPHRADRAVASFRARDVLRADDALG